MTTIQFTLAVLFLLLTPGPTNTLLALGGYSRGWARALPLASAELAGYLSVIVPVTTLAAPYFNAYPNVALAVRFAAVVWVIYLSVRLWKSAGMPDRSGKDIGWRQIYLTTVLNPKALVIALVIMPHEGISLLAPWLLLFSALVLCAANGWILLGRLLRDIGGPKLQPALLRRTAATCLLLFAIFLAGTFIPLMA